MFSEKLAEFIMRGLPQAVLISVLMTIAAFIFPPLGLLSGAAVALVTLRLGPRQGSLVALVSSVALAVMFVVMAKAVPAFANIPPLAGFLAGMLQWAPIVAMAWVLRESGSWSWTMQLAVGCGLVLILVAYMINPELTAFWRSLLDQFFELWMKQQPGSMSTADTEAALQALSERFTGLILTSFLLSSILALFIGRYLQALRFNPGGFGREFRELRIGLWPAVATLVFVAISFATQSQIAMQLAMITGSVFIFQGLAVIHSAAAVLPGSEAVASILLFAVYGLLILMMAFAFTVIAGLGLLDAFVNIRAKLPSNAATETD